MDAKFIETLFELMNFNETDEEFEARKVAVLETENLLISTVGVPSALGGRFAFETAVRHDGFSDNVIIVAAYESREAAAKGHDEWVAKMTAAELPAELEDVGTDFCTEALRAKAGGRLVFRRAT